MTTVKNAFERRKMYEDKRYVQASQERPEEDAQKLRSEEKEACVLQRERRQVPYVSELQML